ncbi:cobalamin biosynthesis protein [Paraburkholderia phymatum]|uniref:Cobalamin (Vitamin B12) biosynthesis CbiG protein n=1 Tax=Paraburkholderia phymatum (strain DSM 17167 / CIP 108236 / LMG 21445 / STM815) TaxID=391038 RepID=B2JRJ6_PARP8|nr:cobalamin biosynthesis protein [Paraburkholderia phymatum]ACC72323.1 cobalamin (vitamin B12) biosynthesis CbiG protein [Paraburkholderia phymatum STM815]
MTGLIVGIGCRRGVSAEQIEAAVRDALGGTLPFDALGAVATVDMKAGEPGLVAFCARHALPLRTFTREQIAALDARTNASHAVREHMGVDGVCEPCALLATQNGRLLVHKRARDGVTVAIACAADAGRAIHQHSNYTPGSKDNR